MKGSLQVPESKRCPFCDYLSGERRYIFLYRNSELAVAVTREQRGRSHLIVFPVEHHLSLLDLPDRLTGPLMRAVRDAARTIQAAEEADGIAVWQNNGLAASQVVPHVHFHVAGALPEGGTNFGSVPEISLEAAQEIADRLEPFTAVACNRASE